MSNTGFKTVEEQIELLKKRNLQIDDEEVAKDFLINHNYYRVSGYSLTLRKDDVFFENANFQNIIDIYSFDHELQALLLQYIQMIEVRFKSIYVYEFSKTYGEYAYLDVKYFADVDKYKQIMIKSEEQRVKSLKHEAYIKHFNAKSEDMPFWAYVDLFTIADISILYLITKSSDENIKDAVAKHFNLTNTKASEILQKSMHSLTIIRNMCAHGRRLYNRLFEQKPFLSKKQKDLLMKNESGNIDNSRLYGFVLLMKQLLTSEDFECFKTKLITIANKYPFVGMKFYGFRADYKEKL